MDDSDDSGPISQQVKKRRRLSEQMKKSSSQSAMTSNPEIITIDSDGEPVPASAHIFQSKEEFDAMIARLKAIIRERDKDAQRRTSVAKSEVSKLRSSLSQQRDEYRDLEERLVRKQEQIDHTKFELLSLERKLQISKEATSGSEEKLIEAMTAIEDLEKLAKELPGRLRRITFESKDTTMLNMLAPFYQEIVQRYFGADRAAMLGVADDNPPPLQHLDEATKRSLTSILYGLRTQPFYHVFAQPVTEDVAPGYFDFIKQPMDLSTIREKLQADEYQSLSQFVGDFKLMFDNCRRYNRNESSYKGAADGFEQKMRHLMERRGLRVS